MAADVVVLISGRGSNLQALIDFSHHHPEVYRIVQVISDRPQAAGLQLAQAAGIKTQLVSAARGDHRGLAQQLACTIDKCAPQIVALAGFMRILSTDFVARYAGRMVNIHPSLLPHFKGLHTHRRVLEAGSRRHGASVHFVTAELDGGPVLLQGRLAVAVGEQEEELAARVLRLEHQIYPFAVSCLATGRLLWRNAALYFDGHLLSQPLLWQAGSASAVQALG